MWKFNKHVLCSILSLTLLSLGLSSVAARSGHSIDDLKKKVKGKSGHSSTTVSKSSTKHSSSSASVSCSSSSYAAAYKKSKNGFADVCAFPVACVLCVVACCAFLTRG